MALFQNIKNISLDVNSNDYPIMAIYHEMRILTHRLKCSNLYQLCRHY